MEVARAQKEVRTVYLGGCVGQLVSSALWGASALLATRFSLKTGGLFLVLGGFFIFPCIQLILRLMGRPASLRGENPLAGLAMQVAFTLPLTLPLVGAVALLKPAWFYPAFMIVLGAHYLPFVFLYGMPMFAVLCGLLVGGGVLLGLYAPGQPVLGAWMTAAVLLVFALLGRFLVAREAGRDVTDPS